MQSKNSSPQSAWKLKMLSLNLLLVPLLLGMSCSAIAHVYKSVDSEGNVVFSDTPGDGSEAIQLPEINVMPAVDVPEYEPPAAEIVEAEEPQPGIIIIEEKNDNSRRKLRRRYYISPHK